jgi:hypothetical protein
MQALMIASANEYEDILLGTRIIVNDAYVLAAEASGGTKLTAAEKKGRVDNTKAFNFLGLSMTKQGFSQIEQSKTQMFMSGSALEAWKLLNKRYEPMDATARASI